MGILLLAKGKLGLVASFCAVLNLASHKITKIFLIGLCPGRRKIIS